MPPLLQDRLRRHHRSLGFVVKQDQHFLEIKSRFATSDLTLSSEEEEVSAKKWKNEVSIKGIYEKETKNRTR